MQESTAFDEAVDHGRMDGQIRILLLQGRQQFGPADAATEAELRAIVTLLLLLPKADGEQFAGILTYGDGTWRVEFNYESAGDVLVSDSKQSFEEVRSQTEFGNERRNRVWEREDEGHCDSRPPLAGNQPYEFARVRT